VIHCAETKTFYEFYGDLWHGNPAKYNQDDFNNVVKKTFGELYAKTMAREKFIKDNGYNVVSIWESDFEPIFRKAKNDGKNSIDSGITEQGGED
jgi:ubiquinone biosynthesis protein Coq4